jgi:hypothetical protein
MTVAELIELLKTFPQDLPVTGYNGSESTDWITPEGINLEDTAETCGGMRNKDGTRYEGRYLDIMGF